MKIKNVTYYDGLVDYLQHKNMSMEQFITEKFLPFMVSNKDTWVTNMTHNAKTPEGKGYNCYQLFAGMIFRYFIEMMSRDDTFKIDTTNLYRDICFTLEGKLTSFTIME